ncbi:MAG: hypothetical protein ACRDZ4_17025 [Egibacteraceae bacterium]
MNSYCHSHILGKIAQIIPADSWYAEYRGDGGQPFHMRLVAWALVEGTEGIDRGVHEVRGLACDADEGVDFADDVSNFVRYVHTDDCAKDPAVAVAPTNVAPANQGAAA